MVKFLCEQPIATGDCLRLSRPHRVNCGQFRGLDGALSRRAENMRTKPLQTEIADAKSSVPTSALRRSKRVNLDLPLMIRGETEHKRAFQEETFTLTVSAHGGLVLLQNRVALGQNDMD